MAGNVPVREYASVEEMRAHAKALRARTFGRVAPPAAEPTSRTVDVVERQARLKRAEQDRRAAEAEALFLASKDELAATMRQAVKGTPVKVMIREYAEAHGVTYDDLVGPQRTMPLAHIRQDAMSFVREHKPSLSLPAIGRLFGGRNHATVLHGIRASVTRRANGGHQPIRTAWCPPDRRTDYRTLRAHVGAAEARRIIEADIAAKGAA